MVSPHGCGQAQKKLLPLDLDLALLVLVPRLLVPQTGSLESAKSKSLFYTKNTLPTVVIFSFPNLDDQLETVFLFSPFGNPKFAIFSPIRVLLVLGKPMEY